MYKEILINQTKNESWTCFKKQEYIKKRKIDEVNALSQVIWHSDDNHNKKKIIDLDYYQELLAKRLKQMKF